MTVCPPAENLRELLQGELPPDLATELREHIQECGTCLEILDHLSDDPDVALCLAAGGERTRRVVLEGLRTTPFLHPAQTLGPPRRPGDLGTLGPYDIEVEVGHGGTGVVYRARELTMGRVVALKVLRCELADDHARERFVREVRAASRVEHDHIVRIYATAQPADPILCFAMEYLAGPSLAERLRGRGRLGAREAALVVAQTARGLAAAHAAGLVHRDVKPDNILFESTTGRAKIGDFGLARLVSEATGLTRDGVVVGTPAYLSPEQARGESNAGPLADVYALGVTLYECLAGEPPFRGSPHRVVHQILNDDPCPPRALNDATPRELETICLKAMAKEPHLRYASAADLADDLDRWLRSEPIRAHPIGPIGRFTRLARRKPLVACLFTALVLALISGTTAAVILWRRAEASAALAHARLLDAELNYRQARDAVDKLYLKLYLAKVLNKPGLESTRTEVAREIIRYYRGFLAQRGHDPALRADAAEASLRVGLLTADTGDKREALTALDEARALLIAIAHDRPGDLEPLEKLARCHDQTAYLLQQLGRSDEAIEAHIRASDVYKQLAVVDPKNLVWKRSVGNELGNLANTYAMAGRKDEARRAYAELKARQEELVRLAPRDVGFRGDLSLTLNNMAFGASVDMKLPLLRDALKLRRELAAELPNDPYCIRNVARTLYNIGVMYEGANRFADALPVFGEACDLLQKATAQAPGHLVFRGELAAAQNALTQTLMELNRPDEAFAALSQNRKNLDELLRIDPANISFLQSYANLIDASARVHEQRGHIPEALDDLESERALLERLRKDSPDRSEIREELNRVNKKIETLRGQIAKHAPIGGK
jgi:tetratricopeptide (TPR) repeat protein/tRNA A-37 threonylcarbamoyl transferase component Bud32